MRTLPPWTLGQSRAGYRIGRALLAMALLATLVLSGRGLSDEGAVSLHGDMPRYLMNGVFLHDLVGAGVWKASALMTYALHYYARYPALSIGHHPPLLAVALVPFFGLFGISVFSARLCTLAFQVTSVVLLYEIVHKRYNEEVAGWSAILYATNPLIVEYAQGVFSEIPMLTLVLAAIVALERFRWSGRRRDYLLFAAAAAASLLAKQLAIFVFPLYVAMLLWAGGWTRLVKRDLLWWNVAALVAVAALGVATLAFSPFNASIAERVLTSGKGLSNLEVVLPAILRDQLLPSLAIVFATGLVGSLLVRDPRIRPALLWIASVVVGVIAVTGPYESSRYSLVAIPAYCIVAASLVALASNQAVRAAVTTVLTVAVGAQAFVSARTVPVGGHGYEDAAKYVLAASPGPTVLYSASIDTGFFVFFARKHDASQNLVVLRSDKVLSTSLMDSSSVEDHIKRPEDIYPILDRFGTKFVVIEDQKSDTKVLNWLRTEVKGNRFVERARFPIATTDRRLRNVDVAVYEYLDAKQADRNAELDISLPLVNREIKVRLVDLVSVGQP